MPFDQALIALAQGLKIRLPEWSGYWKALENAQGELTILDFTGEGPIQTTLDGTHLFRTDWQLVPY